jgi:hypothetical protein
MMVVVLSAVIILNSPCAVITAVVTWITLVADISKRIVGEGEGTAMAAVPA